MSEAGLLVVGAIVLVVVLIALNLAVASLRARFVGWLLNTVRGPISRVLGIPHPDGEERPRTGLRALFDVMEGRSPGDSAELPRQRSRK